MEVDNQFDTCDYLMPTTPRRSKTSCGAFSTPATLHCDFPFSTSQHTESSFSAAQQFSPAATSHCHFSSATLHSNVAEFDERQEIFPIITHKSSNGVTRLEILMEESGSPDIANYCPMQMTKLPDIGANKNAI